MSDRDFKVIDCFSYYDEYGKEMLRLRVEMLKNYVDYFIITELNKTHSGVSIERKLKERIKEYNLPEDKIIVIELDIPEDENIIIEEIDRINCYEGNHVNRNSLLARARERMQKDAPLLQLGNFSDNDIFIISDADEIIDPKIIDFYSSQVKKYPDYILKFPLVHLEGRADLRVVDKISGEPKWWDSLFMCSGSQLKLATPTQIRSNVNNPFINSNYQQDGRVCVDLGWHFSWMGGEAKRKIKATSFIHFDDTFSFLENSKYENSDDVLKNNPKVGDIPPSGDVNFVLESYSVENLPNEIFNFKDVENFLLPSVSPNVRLKTSLQGKLIDFINDPYNPEVNLDLGFLYEKENQLASAISHYLRGAEHGLDSVLKNRKHIVAECLIRAAVCMDKLGGRNYSTKSLILHAISHLPGLPQAHLQMSKIYELTKEWGECHAACSTGLELVDNFEKLKYDSRSKEEILNELLYQKAISSYYIGQCDKARTDLVILRKKPNIQNWIVSAIDKSLETIGYPSSFNQIWYGTSYVSSNKKVLKKSYISSYSQAMQDIFVSNVIDKTYGFYIEIGDNAPVKHSNTNLLEREYYWTGVAINSNYNTVNNYNSTRKNKALLLDTLNIDYRKLFSDNFFSHNIDYLSLNGDTADNNLHILNRIPFDKYRFASITFKHDSYSGDTKSRDESRKLLRGLGYELLVSDVAYNCLQPYEDWWIQPDIAESYTDRETLNLIKDTSPQPKCVLDIFIN